MEHAAAWFAPIATTIAACMTAANLGPRLTGWGFVVFAFGAIAWAAIGLSTGQGNLVWQNAILLGIDLIGVWRWLGREARYARVAHTAEETSVAQPGRALISAKRLTEADLAGPDGEPIGCAVDAMVCRREGRILYLVVREGGVGGVGETLHAVPWEKVRPHGDAVALSLDAASLRTLPPFSPEERPASAAARP